MAETGTQIIVKDPYEFFSMLAQTSFTPFKEMSVEPAKFVLHGFVKEALFANFKGKQIKLASRYYYLINANRSVGELDLSEAADFFARELLQMAFVSSGTGEEFLKTLLTNYTIAEHRTEERGFQEIKELPKEEKTQGPHLEWRFGGQRR